MDDTVERTEAISRLGDRIAHLLWISYIRTGNMDFRPGLFHLQNGSDLSRDRLRLSASEQFFPLLARRELTTAREDQARMDFFRKAARNLQADTSQTTGDQIY